MNFLDIDRKWLGGYTRWGENISKEEEEMTGTALGNMEDTPTFPTGPEACGLATQKNFFSSRRFLRR